MRIFVLAVTGAAALAAGTPVARAQHSADATSKAADVLAATRQALGESALDAAATFTVQATLQRNVGDFQASSQVEIKVDGPDKYLRTDVPSGGMGVALTQGFNGGQAVLPTGARLTPGGGMMIAIGGGPAAAGHSADKPTPEQLEEMNRTAVRSARHEISRLMLGWFAITHPALKARYTYAGEAESPDGKAHVIDVKDDDGFAARLFVDQATKLPLMLTYQGRAPRVVTSTGPRGSGAQPDLHALAERPPVEITLFFDDWREAGGVRFPHVVRRASEGTTNEEWTITSVRVNR